MTDDVWREFFDSFAPQYMNEAFTADSAREAEFLLAVLALEAGPVSYTHLTLPTIYPV